ncbi:hypothetical protein Chor_002259 [Crotalus horridus]
MQDYKRLQSKVEKYEEKEKTGPILTKLHQAREELRPVKDDFEAKNKQLLEEMPKFYSSRIDYFKPSFESLIRAQLQRLISVLDKFLFWIKSQNWRKKQTVKRKLVAFNTIAQRLIYYVGFFKIQALAAVGKIIPISLHKVAEILHGCPAQDTSTFRGQTVMFEVVYYTEMYKIFGELTEQIDEPDVTDEQREKESEAKLNELRALSIVADD